MKETTRNISLEELQLRFNLSVRAYNVCFEMGFKTFGDIQEYLKNNKDFRKIKNCGKGTNEELLSLNKYLSSNSFELNVHSLFEKLSTRAKNVLFKWFNNKLPDMQIIKEQFIDKKFNASNLTNVGVRTNMEIKLFSTKLIDLYNDFLTNNIACEEVATNKLLDITGIEIEDQFLMENFKRNNFPIITFAVQYLENIFGLDKIELLILKSHFNLTDEKLTLKDIAKKFTYSGERIRQKKESILSNTYSIKTFFNLLPYSSYNRIIEDNPFIIIPDTIKDQNLVEEIKTFGNSFSAFILDNIFHPDYYSLNLTDKVNKPHEINLYDKYRLHKRINGTYLIKESFLSKQSILKIYETLLYESCQRRISDEFIDFNLISGNKISQVGKEIAYKIVQREFGFVINSNNIILPRNSVKQVFEFAHEALIKIGKPAHVSELTHEIKKINPGFNSSENSLKATMGRHKDIFIHFGRSSTFGLKIWEKSHPNIKGGTIRDIVEEFLNHYDEPCHISAVTNHVNKYRRTDLRSVLTNLKIAGITRFIFFKNNYVGLTSKNYNDLKQMTNKPPLEEISLEELLADIFKK